MIIFLILNKGELVSQDRDSIPDTAVCITITYSDFFGKNNFSLRLFSWSVWFPSIVIKTSGVYKNSFTTRRFKWCGVLYLLLRVKSPGISSFVRYTNLLFFHTKSIIYHQAFDGSSSLPVMLIDPSYLSSACWNGSCNSSPV